MRKQPDCKSGKIKRLSSREMLHKLAAYCSRSEHCIDDIYKKMINWEAPESEKQEIINYLIREKYIDEERYCKAFIHDKVLFAHWGKIKIRHALLQKRIPANMIDKLLEENEDKDSSNRILFDLLTAKNKSVKAQTSYERRNKLIRFALSRGFEYGDIQKVLNRMSLPEEDE